MCPNSANRWQVWHLDRSFVPLRPEWSHVFHRGSHHRTWKQMRTPRRHTLGHGHQQLMSCPRGCGIGRQSTTARLDDVITTPVGPHLRAMPTIVMARLGREGAPSHYSPLCLETSFWHLKKILHQFSSSKRKFHHFSSFLQEKSRKLFKLTLTTNQKKHASQRSNFFLRPHCLINGQEMLRQAAHLPPLLLTSQQV